LILLDCISTIHLFINQSLVKNTRNSSSLLFLGINNSTKIVKLKADYDGIEVWYNK